MSPAAEAPRPDEAPCVVAATILKDEDDNLLDLFHACEGLVDAWVVVDTGSTDGTPETCETLAAMYDQDIRVIHDVWDDDFARSRNVGLDALVHEFPEAGWVLILDGDDRPRNWTQLRKDLVEQRGNPDLQCIGLRVISSRAPEGSTEEEQRKAGVEVVIQPRIWRPRLGIRYELPVHMQADLRPLQQRTKRGLLPPRVHFGEPAWIEHGSYSDPAHRKANWERALRIVRAKLPPEHPHRVYCEVRSLAALGHWAEVKEIGWLALDRMNAYRALHDEAEALIDAGSKPPDGVRAALAAGPPLRDAAVHILLANALIICDGDVTGAVEVLTDAVTFAPTNPDLWTSLLHAAALGLSAYTQAVAKGQPAMYSTAHNAYAVIAALDDAGLFGGHFPAEDLAALREFSQRLYNPRQYNQDGR
jgi:hypothetical protein